jgi:hypothetical protein
MITIQAIPTKLRAQELRPGDIIVTKATQLDRIVEVSGGGGKPTITVGYYRYRIHSDHGDFAVHEDPRGQCMFNAWDWVRIIRMEARCG